MTRRRAAWSLAVGTLALLVAGCSGSQIELKDMVAPDGQEWRLATGLRDSTAELCPAVHCAEALTTDQAVYYKFDRRSQAREARSALGADAVHDRYVVVHFDEALPQADREEILKVVRGTHTSQE